MKENIYSRIKSEIYDIGSNVFQWKFSERNQISVAIWAFGIVLWSILANPLIEEIEIKNTGNNGNDYTCTFAFSIRQIISWKKQEILSQIPMEQLKVWIPNTRQFNTYHTDTHEAVTYLCRSNNIKPQD